MIASLPMYDRPETAAAHDRLWQAIQTRLGYGPKALLRGENLADQWLDPDLLLSQTCGLPYRSILHGKVQLLCAPVFDLPDCPPGHYRSVLVARRDDPRQTPAEFDGARFAYNEGISQSGWAAPMNFLQDQNVTFGSFVKSGAHQASAAMVAAGGADLASLDILSWVLMQRHESFASGLKEIARTPPTPAMPYITALARDPAPIREALATAITDISSRDRHCLGLKGITQIPAKAFLLVPTPPPPPPEMA